MKEVCSKHDTAWACAHGTMHAPACVHCARRCLTALCAAAAYRLGNWSSNACPTGSTRIDSATACQGAAAALGRSWGWSSSWNNYPNGCVSVVSTYSNVYFNTHATGGSSVDAQPLCFAGAPLSPWPPSEPCPTPSAECRWRSPASANGPYIRFAVTAAPTTVPTAEGVDSISMAQESGGTWTWSCSARCSSTGSSCYIRAAGSRLVGPLTPLIGRLQCRNQITGM